MQIKLTNEKPEYPGLNVGTKVILDQGSLLSKKPVYNAVIIETYKHTYRLRLSNGQTVEIGKHHVKPCRSENLDLL